MSLGGKRAIVLAEDQYQELELWYPLLRLRGVGMEVQVVGTGSASSHQSKHGYPVQVDATADEVKAGDIDAIIIPGGYAPDAGWVLVSAGILKGRTATSFYAIKDDMVNAGARWIDEEVVQDDNLITSRTPDDLPAFTDAIIAALGGIEVSGLERVTEQTNALEALRMAIRAEEGAYEFYSMAAKKTQDPEAKNIFHRLAQDEERHRAIVQDEYNQLTIDPNWDRYSIWREVM
jgi:protease I